MRSTLKGMLPKVIIKQFKYYKKVIFNYSIKKKIQFVQYSHVKRIKNIHQRERIKVAFFLIHDSVWKYDGIYELLKNDPLFDPVVVVCPIITQGEEIMVREMDKAYEAFSLKGYNVVRSLNGTTKQWLDVKKEIKPDIVFFTNPHNLTKPEYYISNYYDTLTCYVPYGFKNSYLHDFHYNLPMFWYLWKIFYETEIHKNLARKYSFIKGVNGIVTGYPGMDKLLDKNYTPVDVWKIKNRALKRIIWAPHHTLPGVGEKLDYSTFLQYSDVMFEIAEKYNDKIQIAFKPHPLLRPKLYKYESWGKERTDKYYERWHSLPNGQLHDVDYTDLFLTSDAMIHDSSSFVVEYLYTKKPVQFLFNNDEVKNHFNELGQIALTKLYQAKKTEDIYSFIVETVLRGNDPKAGERETFYSKYLQPPAGTLASMNIYNYLKTALRIDSIKS